MQSGRPKKHCKPAWVTWLDRQTNQREFYALDKDAKLLDKSCMVHHIRPASPSSVILEAAVPELTVTNKGFGDQAPDVLFIDETFGFESDPFPDFRWDFF
jgi:hypothetical protein